MKNFTSVGAILLLSIVMEACNLKDPVAPKATTIYSTNCYQPGDQIERVGGLSNVAGEIVLVQLSRTGDPQYLIKAALSYPFPQGYQILPLGACNLPDKFKVEGLKINFSGELYWYQFNSGVVVDAGAQPFVLTRISEQ